MVAQFKKYILTSSTSERLSFILRIIATIAGVYQLAFGEKGIGMMTLLSVAAITVPSVVTRGNIKSIPIQFELIFIIMVMIQLVIGETLDFYNNVPYYDKFVHFSLPFFIGFMSFIIAYTLDQTGKLSISTIPLLLILIFFTLGVGALWEIIEYTTDHFINPLIGRHSQLQGSVVESAIDDTMKDLILDMLGGIFGALLGLWYVLTKNKKNESQFKTMVSDISQNYSRKRSKRLK